MRRPYAQSPTRKAVDLPAGADTGGCLPEVVIRASSRRRKTASASWEGERIVVVVPAHLSLRRRGQIATDLAGRLASSKPYLWASDDDLYRRAEHLADLYLDGLRARSVRWVANQNRRWGSCTIASGDIRLSDRLRVVPDWVLDAVLVHELAHLAEPRHSRAFKALIARYSRMSEADTFLEGFALGLEQASAAEARGT